MLAGEVGSFLRYDVPEHIQYYIYGSYGTNWKHLHRNNSLIARGKKKKAFASLFLQTNKQKEESLWTSVVLTIVAMFYPA